MQQPWRKASGGEIEFAAPEPTPFEPGAWADVEAALGTALPRDYKDLIADGGACGFGGELLITSPFDPRPSWNLLDCAAPLGWALAISRDPYPDWYPVAIYPEPGGLLGWGSDGGGADYYWVTSDPDPDRWTIAVAGRPVSDPWVQVHPVGLTGYLAGLTSGSISAAALSGWPSPDARIERLGD